MKRMNLCVTILAVLLISLLVACVPDEVEPEREIPTRTPNRTSVEYQATPGNFFDPYATPSAAWPTGPVTIVVPFLAGGDTDMYARMIADFLPDILGQSVYVINEDGGVGNKTAARMSTAEPDGYSVLFFHTGDMFVNSISGSSDINYHDFEIACVVIHCDVNVMVIRAGLGINNAREFFSYIRENPGGLSVAAVRNTFGHSLLSIAESAGGFELEIADVGAARLKPAAVVGGHADLAYNNLAIFLRYIESGELIPLWIASGQRNPRLPDVPTLAQLGLRDAYIGRSYFFGFPTGTDASIVRELSDAIREVTENEEFMEQLFDAVSLAPSFVPYYQVVDYMEEEWKFYTSLEAYIVIE